MPTLHIQLLQSFALHVGDELITSVNTPRLQSLLAYLLLHRDEPQSRRQIAYCFWPESNDSQARTNLRQLVHHLRRALPDGDQLLFIDAKHLQWQPVCPFSLDVAEFEDALQAAAAARGRSDGGGEQSALARAVDMYGGELLPNCYDDWLLPERERLTQQFVQALERLITLLADTQQHQPAINYAQRLLRQDPLHEAAYRQLMVLHARNGDRARALRVYHTCATSLQRELGVAPDTATGALYEELTHQEQTAGIAPTAPVQPAGDLPLIGRQIELAQLQESRRQAIAGRAHVALVLGEAGIGKTRLLEEVLSDAERSGLAVARARCYAAEGRLAYAPPVEWLRSSVLQAGLAGLDAVWLAELARLLPELRASYPDLPALAAQTEAWERQRLFEALTRAMLAETQPLLLAIDDLQWCDRETLEWLRYVLRSAPQAQLLILATARSGALPDNPALLELLRDLRSAGQVQTLELAALPTAETAALAAAVAGQELDTAQIAALQTAAEGNPLFIVEMIRAGLWPDGNAGADSMPAPASGRLPPKVHAVIETRLSRLSPAARRTAELAATIGREFQVDVLARAIEIADQNFVQALDELWQHRIVREQGLASYDFSHDKIREVAAAGVGLARRRNDHRRVLRALEAVYAPNPDAVSGRLAYHAEQAGLIAEAIPYYQTAGDRAQQVYANEEAIHTYGRGLALLAALPEHAERTAQEIRLRTALGPALVAGRGYAAAEVAQNFGRARQLCEDLPDDEQLFPALWGLYIHAIVRDELHTAHQLGHECRQLALAAKDPAMLVAADFALGTSLFHLGHLQQACRHLERAVSCYEPQQHARHAHMFGADMGVFSLAHAAFALWHLGATEQALQRSEQSLALAEELAHPFSRAIALVYAATVHEFASDVSATCRKAGQTIAECRDWGFVYYLAWAGILYGWALAEAGEPANGIARMEQGLADLRATGAGLRTPHYLTILAETYLKCDDLEHSQERADEALRIIEAQDEYWCAARLYRLQGKLARRRGAAGRADEWQQRADEIAHWCRTR